MDLHVGCTFQRIPLKGPFGTGARHHASLSWVSFQMAGSARLIIMLFRYKQNSHCGVICHHLWRK